MLPRLGRLLVDGLFCLLNLVLRVVVDVAEVGGEFVQSLSHLAEVDEFHSRLFQ